MNDSPEKEGTNQLLFVVKTTSYFSFDKPGTKSHTFPIPVL